MGDRLDAVFEDARDVWRPPPRLSLVEWADRHFVLAAESAAEPGRWRTLAYQRGMMEAMTDPTVERVSIQKSARIGYTKMIDALTGYHMDADPCPIMVVQPTVEDAQGFSKDEIAPMLRDVDVLAKLVGDPSTRVSESTILSKAFPGGKLLLVGANSARGFRRVSIRVLIFDEVDGYPASAGSEGDQIRLGEKRTEYYWNRKIVAGSTPLIAGASRIEQMYEAGDRRRYYVPCPQCSAMDFLTFRERDDRRGHWMQWPEGAPRDAYFVCRENGCIIEHQHKREMLERGEWRADAPFRGHASFHIWAAYSVSPNAEWGMLAEEFIEAKSKGPRELQTFVNTTLGETWQDRGDAPAWERLYERREQYAIGTVPSSDVVCLTCGVDVQKDRLVYEVVGWARNRESWSVDAGLIMGDSSDPATWAKLEELLDRDFPGEGGRQFKISMMAIDSGYNTQQVYAWCRPRADRVMAIKGVSSGAVLVGVPKAAEVNVRGRRMQRGLRVWPIGVHIAKGEFYGWLRLALDAEVRELEGQSGDGVCHFPEHAPEYFRQITAEHLVTIRKRGGFTAREWQLLPGRENHWLDCRVYARAAAAVLGLDRMAPPPSSPSTPAAGGSGTSGTKPAKVTQAPASPRKGSDKSSWLDGGKGGKDSGGWMSRRRRRRR